MGCTTVYCTSKGIARCVYMCVIYHRPAFVISSDVRCVADLSFGLSHQHMVTVVVAACLASTILIILIAYVIVKSRNKLRYATMD